MARSPLAGALFLRSAVPGLGELPPPVGHGARRATEPRWSRKTKNTLPVLTNRPRRVRVSFCSREGDVGDSSFGTNVEHADNALVRTRFITSNDDSLLGIKLDQAFQ